MASFIRSFWFQSPRLPVRLGVDPLHAHLLPPLGRSPVVEPRLAFSSAAGRVRELKGGFLDAVLLPLAGRVGPSEPTEPPALSAVAALNPSLGDPEVVAIEVASSSLPFLVAGHHLVHNASAVGSSGTVPRVAVPRVAVLLPPARNQPLLNADLIHQALLPLRCCSNIDPAVWIELLLRERLLLPAPLSLLAHSPWRAAGFAERPPRLLGVVVVVGSSGAPGSRLGGGAGGGGEGEGVGGAGDVMARGIRGPSALQPVSRLRSAPCRTDGPGQRDYQWIRGHDPDQASPESRNRPKGPPHGGPFFLGVVARHWAG
jgi:hypothetical protein